MDAAGADGDAFGRGWRQTWVLAWRDAVHEWPVSLCLVLALAAVLAPLLVLFGLKSGIVTTMRERLRSDPRTVEISLRGHYRLDLGWFEELRARPEVAFIIPRTRTLSATMSLETTAGRSLLDVDMVPTAAGDPLLPAGLRPPDRLGAVLLTKTLAQKLRSAVGDPLTGIVSRRLNDKQEAVRIPLTVSGVLPEASFGRDALFVSLPLLVATEDYRDGFPVPEVGVATGTGERASTRPFASFRLYARSLDDVEPLAGLVRARNLEVVTRSSEIASVRAIDRVLTFVFVVLASIGVTGYLLSLAASLWANVDRKRKEIALLRLVGFGTANIVSFPAMQAMILAGGGIFVSAGIYMAVASAFNAAFTTELNRDEFVCRLSAVDAGAAAAMTIVLALLASMVGGYRAATIEPAEGLRSL